MLSDVSDNSGCYTIKQFSNYHVDKDSKLHKLVPKTFFVFKIYITIFKSCSTLIAVESGT